VVEDYFVGDLEVVSLVSALDGIEDSLPGHPTEGGGEYLTDAFFVDDPLLFFHELGGEAEVGGELVLVPGVLSDFGDGDSLHWIDDEHTRDQVSGELRQVGGEGVHPALDFFEQVGDGLVVEGERATEQGIEYDTTRPDVYFRPCVQVAGDDLGGCVVRRAAGGTEEVPVFHKVAEAEVGELDIVVLGEGGGEGGREGGRGCEAWIGRE